MNYWEILLGLAPELIVACTGLAVIGLGVSVERGKLAEAWRPRLWMIGALGLAAAGAVLGWLPCSGSPTDGMVAGDPLTHLFKACLLLLAALVLALTGSRPERENSGEYLGLMLLATVGFLLAVAANDLLLIFLALEMGALALYILAGFDRERKASVEAALKVFLFGGMSAAFMLFGFSLLYGYTGSTRLVEIGAALGAIDFEPMLAVGVVMCVVGFGFKIAAVPFHLWAPDVYQGAPVPVAALFSSASKVVGFFVLAKFLYVGLGPLAGSADWGAFAPGWVALLLLLAIFSMVLGSLGALAQRRSVRRLLAYSAIAHSGYLLLGLGAATADGLAAALFFTLVYAITALGAFAVVGAVVDAAGNDRPEDFAGLGSRSPLLALCLTLFLVSLAGIPPLAGFIGKFALFASAMQATPGDPFGGLTWAVVLAVALNALSIYYYLLVLKQVWFRPAPTGRADGPMAGTAVAAVVVFSAVLVLGLGLFPGVLFDLLSLALAAF